MFALRNTFKTAPELLDKRIIFSTLRSIHPLAYDDMPRITVPVYLESKMKKHLIKLEKRRMEEIRRKSRQGNTKIPIITCRNPDKNWYLGQVCPRGEELSLVSQRWMKRQSKGDHFTIHRLSSNPSQDTEASNMESNTFDSFDVDHHILKGLEDLNIKHPTIIQDSAIPEILSGENVICSAETGSGKTLAYLVPVLHLMLKDGIPYTESECAPVTVIMAPSRELVDQIGAVTKALAEPCGFNVHILSLNKKKNFQSRMDIAVAAPGTLIKLLKLKKLSLKNVRHVIVDEADTMLDDSFSFMVVKLLRLIGIQNRSPVVNAPGAQLILVGATVPKDIGDALNNLLDIDTLVKVETPQLHRILPHVEQKFLRMGSTHKQGKLLELVKKDINAKRPVIIFSNKTETCIWVSKFLEENGIETPQLHGVMPVEVRNEGFKRFMSGDVPAVSSTDLGSRGLDTVHVQHVINFDFPYHMSDYIHRVGRTGRVGSKHKCFVTNFIHNIPQVALAQKIETAARKVAVLPSVNANIAKLIEDRLERKELQQLGKENPGTL